MLSSISYKHHRETKRVSEKEFKNFYAIIATIGHVYLTKVRKRSCKHKNGCFKLMEMLTMPALSTKPFTVISQSFLCV